MLDKILNFLRSCINCGSWNARSSMLCLSCEKALLSSRRKSSVHKNDLLDCGSYVEVFEFDKRQIDIYYHFNWVENENRILSLILKNLKTSKLIKSFRYFGHLMAQNGPLNADYVFSRTFKSNQKSQEIGKIYIIPCPSSSKDRLHSQNLAAFYAQVVGGVFLDILVLTGKNTEKKNEQKNKSSSERQSLTFDVKDRSFLRNILQENDCVIFIDDIVTTGASAKAGFLALEKPKNFIVHALARRRLAGPLVFC